MTIPDPGDPLSRWAAAGRSEPASNIRQTSSILWQLYLSLTEQGFTKQEALYLTGEFLQANAPKSR